MDGVTGLEGLTVAVTGSRRASELARLISNFGGVPYVAPTVGIEVGEEVDREVEALVPRIVGGEIDYAVFMTGPGVHLLMSKAKQLGLERELVEALNRIWVVGRSQKPQKVLEGCGVRVSLVPDDNTSEGIAAAMKGLDLRGKTVAIVWPGAPQPVLRDALEAGGATVFEAMAYQYSDELEARGAETLEALGFKSVRPEAERVLQLIADVVRRMIHIITFTSPPSARNLFRMADAHGMGAELRRCLNEAVLVVAVGVPTRSAIEEHGVHVDVMPEVFKLGAMVRATVEYLAGARPGERKKVPAEVRAR